MISLWENISTDAIESKVDYLISNSSPKDPTKLRPQVTLSVALSYDSKFMTQIKVKTKKSEGLNLKDFVTRLV